MADFRVKNLGGFIVFFILHFIIYCYLMISEAFVTAQLTLIPWILFSLAWCLNTFECEFGCTYIFLILAIHILLFELAVVIMYGVFAQQMVSWFPLASLPCGRSSCLNLAEEQPFVTKIPYHPLGQYSLSHHPYYSFCPIPRCRWADTTGEAIQGYPELEDDPTLPDTSGPSCNTLVTSPTSSPTCAYLATTNGKDYMDLGKGLRLGYYPGVVSTDTAFCPMIDPGALQPDNVTHGRGVEVCSTCTHYLSRVKPDLFPIPTRQCPMAAGDDSLCFICKDLSIAMGETELGVAFFLLVFQFLSGLVFTGMTVYDLCVHPNRPTRKRMFYDLEQDQQQPMKRRKRSQIIKHDAYYYVDNNFNKK